MSSHLYRTSRVGGRLFVRAHVSSSTFQDLNSEISLLKRRVTDLETKVGATMIFDPIEKPLFRFQRASQTSGGSGSKNDDNRFDYDIDLTVSKGQFVGGIAVLMFFYGVFIK